MKFLQSKYSIGLIGFALGGAAMFVTQKMMNPKQYRPGLSLTRNDFGEDRLLDTFFNDDFFDRSHDPFEEMRKMRKQMSKQFGEETGGGGLFDSWYKRKFGGGNAGEIQKREDDKFVYYDVAIDGLDKNKLNVKVVDGQITISGRQEKKSEEGNTGTYFSSSFHRSFPLPLGVDGNDVQMEQNKGKLVVKFAKVKA